MAQNTPEDVGLPVVDVSGHSCDVTCPKWRVVAKDASGEARKINFLDDLSTLPTDK